MNYTNPDMTVRQGVEACLATVNNSLAALDPVIAQAQTDAAGAFDTGTVQALNNCLNSLRGTKINLQAEADRLQGIIDGWSDETPPA